MSDEIVRFDSPDVVTASYYPSESQVDVSVARVDQLDHYEELIVSGMVGRASPARLLRLAAKKLRTNDPASTGDQSCYTRLGDAGRREAEAWKAYYEGKDPSLAASCYGPRGTFPHAGPPKCLAVRHGNRAVTAQC